MGEFLKLHLLSNSNEVDHFGGVNHIMSVKVAVNQETALRCIRTQSYKRFFSASIEATLKFNQSARLQVVT